MLRGKVLWWAPILVAGITGLTAQEFRATLVGRISDPSGAAVAGARVIAIQKDTNARYETLSTATGDYTMPFLPPGPYRVEVERQGFRKFVRDGVVLRIQERAAVDVSLQIGELAEAITVTGESPLLETSTASVGEVVTQRAIEEMPLNGRNAYGLVGLVPGALPTGRGTPSFFLRYTATGTTTTAEVSISGGPVAYNEVLLDGVSITGNDNGILYIPSVEATQEFKVQTNSFDAEFGRFVGGIVNASTKSGTNQFHGSVVEFFRNSALNARDFFASSKPQSQYNQFSVAAGAPVYIPKVYNGRDRTFFFVTYDGSREGVARAFVSTVPTELERRGDFSQTFTRQTNRQPAAITVYDPATTRQSGNVFVRDPFPGNAIPTARFDPVARNLIGLYPLPVVAGDPVTHANNYPLAFKDPVADDGYIIKVDHRFSPRHTMFARYSWRWFYVWREGAYKNAVTGEKENRYVPGFSVDDTFTLTPTMVLNLRYGMTRYKVLTQGDSFGYDIARLGFATSLARVVDRPALPNVSISGYTGFPGYSRGANIPETHSLRAGLLKHTGRHSLKTGFDARLGRTNRGPGGTNAGSYSFSQVFTRGPNPQVNTITAGSGLASFLLGLGAGGSMTYTASLAEQTPYYGFFVQDDIRVNNRLTVNLGVRYEWEGVHAERYNRFNRGFDFTHPSPINDAVRGNYAANPIPQVAPADFKLTGGLLFAGVGGQPRGMTNLDRNNVAPRFGIAYTLSPTTVLRGGIGLFYGPTTSQRETNYGFSSSTPWVATIDGGLTPMDRLSNPFPSGFVPPPAASQGLLTQVGQGVGYVNPDRRQLYANQFQLSIQRQLPGQVLAEGTYAGTRGYDFPVSRELDPVPERFRAEARQIYVATQRNIYNDQVANPFFGVLSSGALAARTVSRSQLLRPYPQFTSLSAMDLSIGSSQYDSFQLKISKRLTRGLQALVAYTARKMIDRNFYMNATNERLDRAIAPFDVPQRLVVSGSYELPLARGTRGIPGKLLGGWQLNWIYAAQGGAPLSVGAAESLGRSASLPKDRRSLQRWFDTSAFRLRETLELVGTNRLPDVRSPGRNNLDLSLFKTTTLTERVKMQFRLETFNLANRTEFAAPNTTLGSSQFGSINSQINFARQVQLGLRVIW